MGNNHDPVTLHKYLYANADPGNMVDPSGHMVSMSSVMSALNVAATLSTVAITSYNVTGSLMEGDLYSAGKDLAMGAISIAAFVKGPQMFKALFGSCANWCTLFFKFSQAERAIIAEAKAFQAAGAFNKAKAAIASGTEFEITVGTRTAIVVPEYSGSGMTLFGEEAFIIGADAIRTEVEFSKTLLHELYRLSFQRGVTAGAVGGATQATSDAFNFAEKAAKLFVK